MTDSDVLRPNRSDAATVTTVYPGGGESVSAKCPDSSVKAGASFMVKKDTLCAEPVTTMARDDVAEPGVGESIVICGPTSNLRASKKPYPTTKSTNNTSKPR